MSVSALSTRDLLVAWEREAERSAAHRGMELLTMASDVAPNADVLAVGVRDTQLLELRAATFGDELVGLATCPTCGRDLELTFSARALIAAAGAGEEGAISSTLGGYDVSARRLTVTDLATAAHLAADVPDARLRLLRSAVLEATYDGGPASVDELPDELLDDIEERLSAADPVADTQLALHCADCGTEWTETFDIASFFWAELDAWAVRTLEDVHQLAAAYGWQEYLILDMTAHRRRVYLELINS